MSKTTKLLVILLLVLFLGVFLYAGGSLLQYYLESLESQETYDSLAQIMDAGRPTQPVRPVPDPTAPSQEVTVPVSELITVTDPVTGNSQDMLPEFSQLYLLNNEIVGWITIPDSNINYPVVQSDKDNTDYYLYRDYYGKRDSHGCLYMREQCDALAPSDNLVIYGHRMKDHTMFGHLAKYERQSHWQDHRYVHFSTLTERHTYEIVFVFATSSTVGAEFPYHTYVDMKTPAQWEEFFSLCRKYSLYDTGVEPQIGGKLITLSTCEYTQENGRLVVVAQQID